MGSVLETKGLYFSYNGKNVLNNVDMNIEQGKFVSIIGPNGSGKTTLLKNLSSILAPQKGSVLFKGKDLREYKKKVLAKHIAYVPQNTFVEFEFTVMDIVLMGRSPFLGIFRSETEEDKEIAMNAMVMTNTVELKDKKITEISGGERQRVIIACALAQTPEVIILDEPVSNLDIQHQIDVLGILKRSSVEENMTVITVLHDLNLASEYSDTVMLVKDGYLIKSGTPREVITRDNIKNAYKADVYMTSSPLSGKPHIIPVSRG